MRSGMYRLQAAQSANTALHNEVAALRACLAQQQAELQRQGDCRMQQPAPDPPVGQAWQPTWQQQQPLMPARTSVTGDRALPCF